MVNSCEQEGQQRSQLFKSGLNSCAQIKITYYFIKHYLSIAVELLVIGFFPSSTKTKTIFISTWKKYRYKKLHNCSVELYLLCSMGR